MTERNDKVMWGLVSEGSHIGTLFQWEGCDMRKVLGDVKEYIFLLSSS